MGMLVIFFLSSMFNCSTIHRWETDTYTGLANYNYCGKEVFPQFINPIRNSWIEYKNDYSEEQLCEDLRNICIRYKNIIDEIKYQHVFSDINNKDKDFLVQYVEYLGNNLFHDIQIHGDNIKLIENIIVLWLRFKSIID